MPDPVGGELTPEAYRVLLEGYDLDELERERVTAGRTTSRHDRIAEVLRALREGEITRAQARARLHEIDPDHYPPVRIS